MFGACQTTAEGAQRGAIPHDPVNVIFLKARYFFARLASSILLASASATSERIEYVRAKSTDENDV